MTPAQAKRILKLRNWSYRRAAKHLGFNWTNLAKVLTGRRKSQRLLQRIAAIKPFEEASR